LSCYHVAEPNATLVASACWAIYRVAEPTAALPAGPSAVVPTDATLHPTPNSTIPWLCVSDELLSLWLAALGASLSYSSLDLMCFYFMARCRWRAAILAATSCSASLLRRYSVACSIRRATISQHFAFRYSQWSVAFGGQLVCNSLQLSCYSCVAKYPEAHIVCYFYCR
jgi:hypothetical protein